MVGPSNALKDILSRSRAAQGGGKLKLKEDDFRTRRRKLYRLTTEEKPAFPFQSNNFYNHVMENKEVVKTLSLFSTCTQDMKPGMAAFLARWKPYNVLWRNEKAARDMLNNCLNEFEISGNSTREKDVPHRLIASSLAISTEKLKFGLITEIRSCTHRIGEAMKNKYRQEMERKLEKPIRDMDDVRMVMDTLKKIREQEVDMDLKIEPIEEAFNVLNPYNVAVEREIIEQVDNLPYTCTTNLLSKSQSVQCKLLEMQPQFQDELRNNLDKFRQDKIDYCNEYRNAGLMELAPSNNYPSNKTKSTLPKNAK